MHMLAKTGFFSHFVRGHGAKDEHTPIITWVSPLCALRPLSLSQAHANGTVKYLKPLVSHRQPRGSCFTCPHACTLMSRQCSKTKSGESRGTWVSWCGQVWFDVLYAARVRPGLIKPGSVCHRCLSERRCSGNYQIDHS